MYGTIGDIRVQSSTIQVLNVGGIKFDDTWLLSPTTKFSFTLILPAIQHTLIE